MENDKRIIITFLMILAFIAAASLWLWIYYNGITIHGRFYFKNSNSEGYYFWLIFIPLNFSYLLYQWWIEWSFNRGIDKK